MYKLAKDPENNIRQDVVIKNNVVWVPNDPQNRDWQEYQEWLAAGNEPEPAD